jgi:hypothetical protein
MLRLIASQLMAHVTVKTTEEGVMVRPYTSNPQFGYLVLESNEVVMEGEWAREKVRTHIMKGETRILEAIVQKTKGVMPGRIAVREFREGEVPAELQSRINSKLPYEEAVEGLLKRAGKDGPVLTSEGLRILRFTDYDAGETIADTRVAHDNVAEVAAWKQAQGAAKLPK